ncbi:MAG: hypothetical protein HYX59_00480 [Elusimicrobia bacterium]|nr:hypothetical protein [Elusimicrobiota bacterium]
MDSTSGQMNRVAWRLTLAIALLLSFARVHAAQFEIGDILYRDGLAGWENVNPWGTHIGHAGIFIGYSAGDQGAMVVESVPDNENPPGVRKSRWVDFVAGNPYYGNRTTTPGPDSEQRRRISLFAVNRIGLPYDGNHLDQKGPGEFDCVGLTEFVYEAAGLNPTPNSFETGLGWPLTPLEQYEHTTPTVASNPQARVWDISAGRYLSDGEATIESNDLVVRVSDGDRGSGLRLLKILRTDPVAGQEVFRDETAYSYLGSEFADSTGLRWKEYAVPDNLADGIYFAVSLDQAGNEISVRSASFSV